jgi:hypothetical protein
MSQGFKTPDSSTYAGSISSTKSASSFLKRALSFLPKSTTAGSPETLRAPKGTRQSEQRSTRMYDPPTPTNRPHHATHTICRNCPSVNSQTFVPPPPPCKPRGSRMSFISGGNLGSGSSGKDAVWCKNCKKANTMYWHVPGPITQQVERHTDNLKSIPVKEPPKQGPSNWFLNPISKSSAPQPPWDSQTYLPRSSVNQPKTLSST